MPASVMPALTAVERPLVSSPIMLAVPLLARSSVLFERLPLISIVMVLPALISSTPTPAT
jgi:hypothetical protein